jgi:serine/threonine protein phosphatase 1
MTAPEFGASVAPAHTRLDVSGDGTISVVGDVHGCIDELRALWERLAPGSEDRVVFVGDLVRKGPDSDAVVESFPLVVSWDGAIVVHGGVDPETPLGEHSPAELLETRSIPAENGYDGPFWFDSYEGPPRVFFGHTVLTETGSRSGSLSVRSIMCRID